MNYETRLKFITKYVISSHRTGESMDFDDDSAPGLGGAGAALAQQPAAAVEAAGRMAVAVSAGQRAPLSLDAAPVIIDPTIFDGQPVPERRWLVPHLIPRGSVTLLSGDGGVGKSLLAMQLMTAGALDPREEGRKEKWLGVEVEPFASLGFFCEDDEEELHRRQDRINAHYGCRFAELDDVRWMAQVGRDNVMLQYGWRRERPAHRAPALPRRRGSGARAQGGADRHRHGGRRLRRQRELPRRGALLRRPYPQAGADQRRRGAADVAPFRRRARQRQRPVGQHGVEQLGALAPLSHQAQGQRGRGRARSARAARHEIQLRGVGRQAAAALAGRRVRARGGRRHGAVSCNSATWRGDSPSWWRSRRRADWRSVPVLRTSTRPRYWPSCRKPAVYGRECWARQCSMRCGKVWFCRRWKDRRRSADLASSFRRHPARPDCQRLANADFVASSALPTPLPAACADACHRLPTPCSDTPPYISPLGWKAGLGEPRPPTLLTSNLFTECSYPLPLAGEGQGEGRNTAPSLP